VTDGSKECAVQRLEGRVAVVTGAGRGIGAGIARVLAAEGAAVLLASRSLEPTEAVAREIEQKGGRARAVACDVSDRAQVDAAVAAAVDTFGPPDILVNNAQGGRVSAEPVALEDITAEMATESFAGGVLASLYGMQAVFPHFKQQGRGTIVNMASSTGVEGDPGFSPYGIAKEGIRGLTKHAAREWGKHGITVNVLCPAALTEHLRPYAEEHPRWFEAVVRRVPLGRLGDPADDIAPVVLALATDLHYVTGATIMVDGGRCILR
jgi:NAD(P)-dependent dehydrogenase (short-subunit alcohol dehydrogenase family)